MSTQIAFSETMISAFVLGGVMHVFQSTLIEERHRIYKPVREAIERTCSSLIGKARFEDESWSGGSYTWKALRVYDSCPGPTKDHNCTKEVTSGRVQVRITG